MEDYLGEEDTGEIVAWFIPIFVPEGHLSYRVRANLLGLALPIRSENARVGGGWMTYNENIPELDFRDSDGIVIITAEDIVKSLHLAGKDVSALEMTIMHGQFGSNIKDESMVFDRKKGRILSQAEMEQQFPGLAKFDELYPTN